MYLSFDDYKNMGGSVEDENAFNDMEFEAASLIDWYTFNRLQKEAYEDLPGAVKRLMFHLIKMIQIEQASYATHTPGGNKGDMQEAAITSQSNDGVSVHYNVMSASTAADNIKDKISSDIKRYLNGVVNSLGRKLLYRGQYPGE